MTDKDNQKTKPNSWALTVTIALLSFLVGNLIDGPLEKIGNGFYLRFIATRDSPTAWICAPLQEARYIARQGDEILSEGTMGSTNPISVAFFSNRTELEELEILLYPLGYHENTPVIYQSEVVSSEIISIPEMDVTVEGGILRASVPRMARGEFVHIGAVYGQPVSLLLEVRSDNYSGEFFGIAGCNNELPDSFRSGPSDLVHEYHLSNCGENGDEICGIPRFSFEFEVTEERVPPTVEAWTVYRGERQYLTDH